MSIHEHLFNSRYLQFTNQIFWEGLIQLKNAKGIISTESRITEPGIDRCVNIFADVLKL